MPPGESLDIGNTPPNLFYGPGAVNFDWSLANELNPSREPRRTLELRADAFNTFNHFNPNNPNSALTYKFATGAEANASFESMGGARVQARRIVMSARIWI